ncbi:MAG: shikimate kinase [Candidatus Zixiibacteriota bacterium]|nr:MAG: shikimate kinase [candidate division Zixibacteria bacterium]
MKKSVLRKHVVLIGFSGSGKSSVGAHLADRMKVRFYDTDLMIEKARDMKIADIFDRHGEPGFRKLESDMIRTLCQPRIRPGVVALGGGAFQNPNSRKLLLACCHVIYLSCSTREIYRRLGQTTDRPLLRAKPKTGETLRQARLRQIGEMLRRRTANYRKAHHIYSTTGKTVPSAVTDLVRTIRRAYA